MTDISQKILQRYQIRTAKALAEDRAAKEAVLTR